MGEHGASFSGESIYDDTDEGKGVVRIAVRRGAGRVPVRLRQRRHQRRQFGHRVAVQRRRRIAGLRGRLGAARRGRRRADRRPDRRSHRPADGDADRRDPVLRRGAGHRPGAQPLGAGVLPDRRRPRRRHRIGHRARRTSPRSRRPSSAAGSARCSNSPSSPASSSRCWSTTSSRTVAGSSSADWWLGLEAWRWMFIAMVVPGGRLRLAGADHPGIAAVPDRQAPGPGGEGDPHRPARPGEHRRQGRAHPGDDGAGEGTVLAGPEGPGTGQDRDHRLDRPRAVGVPAVRRHQRDLLLLEHPLGGRRLHRETSRSSSP